MARRPLSMRKTREILRLKHEVGLSNHQIAASLHLSHVCVGNYLRRARQAGVGWPIPDTLDDEQLAQRFGVPLETMENDSERRGPGKARLKEALKIAAEFYHFCLLHTEEGQRALVYLYKRGLDLDFIQKFQLGCALKKSGVFLERNYNFIIFSQSLRAIRAYRMALPYKFFFLNRPICSHPLS